MLIKKNHNLPFGGVNENCLYLPLALEYFYVTED